jgi:hypothetical protein
MDGDLEYDANDLLKLLKPIDCGDATFTLGNRHVKGEPMRVFKGHPLRSMYFNFGHEVFTTLFNFLYKTKLRDPATMWKVFNRSQIEGYEFTGQRFEFDWEVMAVLVRNNAKIIEIPISYNSRGKEEGKKIRPLKDPCLWLFWIFAYRLRPMNVNSKK